MRGRVARWLPCFLFVGLSCVQPAIRPEPVVPLVYEPGTGAPGTVAFTGQVTGGEYCRPLSCGAVTVWGTEFGSALDADGGYRISGMLKPGRYTLVARVLGWRDERAQVKVEPGQTLFVDFCMKLAPAEPGPTDRGKPRMR